LVEIEGFKTSGKQQVKLDEYVEEMSEKSDLVYSSRISLSSIDKPIYIGKKNEITLNSIIS